MNIFITGGTGFIGSRLVKKLTALNHRIFVLSRTKKKAEDNVSYISIDDVNKTFQEGIDVVIHMATEYGRSNDSNSMEDVNYQLPDYLLRLSKEFNVKCFLNTDSFYCRYPEKFQHMQGYIKTKDMFKKKLFEEDVTTLKRVNVVISHVCGEGDSSEKFLPWVIDQIYNGNDLHLSECLQELDFIDVYDVAEAYSVIIENLSMLEDKDEYDVGTGNVVQLKKLIYKLLLLMQKKIDVSESILLFGKNLSVNVHGSFKADISKISALGWRSTIPLNESLISMVAERINKAD
tara:strand:+ start:9165 stop:10034 length:870 start_codon:yes stop_codon:yes gene_type:complete